MADLSGKVAVVTGAGRGLGRGIAEGLAEAGATVYVTARTGSETEPPADGSVQATARRVDELGGRGMPLCVDHRREEDVRRLFEWVHAEQGRLDLLVDHILPGRGIARACAGELMAQRSSGLVVTLLPTQPQAPTDLPGNLPDAVTVLGLHARADKGRYTGRCVAALAMDPDVHEKSGGVYRMAELALEYRFSDPDAA